jgi:hypothetical protein
MTDAGYNLDPLEGACQNGDVASGCVGNQPHTCATNRLGIQGISFYTFLELGHCPCVLHTVL